MATGTGKTITALGCINNFQKTKKRTITVIACPKHHYWNRKLIVYVVILRSCSLMSNQH